MLDSQFKIYLKGFVYMAKLIWISLQYQLLNQSLSLFLSLSHVLIFQFLEIFIIYFDIFSEKLLIVNSAFIFFDQIFHIYIN